MPRQHGSVPTVRLACIVGAFVGGYFLSPLFGVGTINEGDFSIPALLLSLGGAVILLHYDQPIEAKPAHFEHVLSGGRGSCDVQDDRDRGVQPLELPKRLEVGHARPRVVWIDDDRGYGTRSA